MNDVLPIILGYVAGAAIGFVALYFVVRLAVAHAIRDTQRPRPAAKATPDEPAPRGWWDKD